jgi:hypothetical protein
MTLADLQDASADTALRASATPADIAGDLAVPTGCPFLLSQAGGWRLDLPSKDPRCAALTPAVASVSRAAMRSARSTRRIESTEPTIAFRSGTSLPLTAALRTGCAIPRDEVSRQEIVGIYRRRS